VVLLLLDGHVGGFDGPFSAAVRGVHPPLRPCLVYPADMLKWAVPADLRAHQSVPGKVCVGTLRS
jgi:hypothetical protein